MQSFFYVCLVLSCLSVVFGAPELDMTSFTAMAESPVVHLVEYFSPMCGSCKEFSPIFTKICDDATSVICAKVNIDTKEGMEVAMKARVLEEGIPNLRLYTSLDGGVENRGVRLMVGDVKPAAEIISLIEHSAKQQGLSTDLSGKYMKSIKHHEEL